MKRLIFLCIVVCVSFSVNAQSYYESRVLSTFFVGYDTKKQLQEKLDFNEINVYSDVVNNDIVERITIYDFFYKNKPSKIILLIVNDVLYGVQYYPLKDKQYDNYVKILDASYTKPHYWTNENAESLWENSTLLIVNRITGDYYDYFVHYNKQLLYKYPQYKNF